MTISEIKDELSRRGWTQADLAEKLAYSAKSLYEVMRGARPMTASLRRHIELLLSEPRETILVYKVDLTDSQVTELCGVDCPVDTDSRAAAVEAVLHHNLKELIELGKMCTWNESERAFLGVDED